MVTKTEKKSLHQPKIKKQNDQIEAFKNQLRTLTRNGMPQRPLEVR